MKIAVVGSRKFLDSGLDMVRTRVRWFDDDDILVSGGAPGVDTVAEIEAGELGLDKNIIRPKWKVNGVYNPAAGFERNTLIVDEADEILAFWDMESSGTLDTIRKAVALDKSTHIYLPMGAAVTETQRSEVRKLLEEEGVDVNHATHLCVGCRARLEVAPRDAFPDTEGL